jgi:hypothetical protein
MARENCPSCGTEKNILNACHNCGWSRRANNKEAYISTTAKAKKVKPCRKVNPATLTNKKSKKKKVKKNSDPIIISRTCKPCGTDSKPWNGGTLIISGGGGPGTGKRR